MKTKPSAGPKKSTKSRGKSPDKNEQILISRIKEGDEKSFEIIFDRYFSRVSRLAFKLIGNATDAEDVVQEVFLLVYNKAKTFKGKSQFSTWLYRITMNTALAKLRKKKKEDKFFVDDYMPKFQRDGHHFARPVVDWSQEVDKIVENKESYDLIQKAIDQLRPIDRAVLVMSDLEEMSNGEIGEITGLSVQAVKARLHRSRLFLRGKLAVHLGHSPT
jgi:RNA polymerase sigma-70 factor, ECF subfamily